MAAFGPVLIMSLPVQVMWPLHKEWLAKSSVVTPEAHGMDALSSVELLIGKVTARKKNLEILNPHVSRTGLVPRRNSFSGPKTRTQHCA